MDSTKTFNRLAKNPIIKLSCALVFACSFFSYAAHIAYAQPPGGGRQKEQAGSMAPAPDRNAGNANNAEAFVSSLKLNAQQNIAVKVLLAEEQKAALELRQAMREKSDALHAATKQKLAKILTAEQLGRYEEFKQANRPPRPAGEPPRRD